MYYPNGSEFGRCLLDGGGVGATRGQREPRLMPYLGCFSPWYESRSDEGRDGRCLVAYTPTLGCRCKPLHWEGLCGLLYCPPGPIEAGNPMLVEDESIFLGPCTRVSLRCLWSGPPLFGGWGFGPWTSLLTTEDLRQ